MVARATFIRCFTLQSPLTPRHYSYPLVFFFILQSYLVQEGRAGQPKMMSVGLHCRLARPARAAALAEFVDYAKSYGREVWICTREQIANHWYENHLPRGIGNPIDPAEFGAKGGTINKGNKFSFLGNLTKSRDEDSPSKTPSASPISDMKDSSESGDVI